MEFRDDLPGESDELPLMSDELEKEKQASANQAKPTETATTPADTDALMAARILNAGGSEQEASIVLGTSPTKAAGKKYSLLSKLLAGAVFLLTILIDVVNTHISIPADFLFGSFVGFLLVVFPQLGKLYGWRFSSLRYYSRDPSKSYSEALFPVIGWAILLILLSVSLLLML